MKMMISTKNCIGVIFLLLSTIRESTLTSKRKLTARDYRLNNDVYPLSYNIEIKLDTDFEKSRLFTGRIEIKFSLKPGVGSTDKQIKLHMKNLTLNRHSITLHSTEDDTNLLSDIPEPDDVLELIKLKPKKTLHYKNYLLTMLYTGSFQNDIHGFYLSSYLNEDQNYEWLATTQFQPTHARKAFPCFDEPSLKSVFYITIIHPNIYHALSNANVESISHIPGQKYLLRTKFEPTPFMSTYIVAFIVSKFSSMSASHHETGRNSAWCRSEFVLSTKYAFEVTPNIVRELDKITGLPYSKAISKLDQVAIPDFSAGAMENWGLVTYRETALLWDPLESTALSKQRIGTVIAHELAHMWFGNLITTDWWSTTWLNEGFANFLEYAITSKVERTWKLEYQFVVDNLQYALEVDALITSEPMTSKEEDVYTPSAISNKFDIITYSKGGSVIRMMQHFMGTKYFHDGLKLYLRAHKYKSTVPEDLWDALQEKADYKKYLPTTIATIMQNWTEKAGFPVVNVNLVGQDVVLTQERFLFHKAQSEASKHKWYIPISFTTEFEKQFSETAPRMWLTPNDKFIKIRNAIRHEMSWIIINIQSTAFIYVNYHERLWRSLEQALKKPGFDNIHVLNRAQIINDAMNLARAGALSYDIALDILLYLENETEYYPWYSAFGAFDYLFLRFNSETQMAKLLNTHVLNLMQKLYKSVSFESIESNHIYTLKKVLTLMWACDLDHRESIDNALRRFYGFRDNSIRIDPDYRSIVYCTTIRSSQNSENWLFLRRILTKTQLASEINIILIALGCTKDETLLYRYLKETIDPTSDIRQQDYRTVFLSAISGNQEGIPVGLQFLKNNLQAIIDNYGSLRDVSVMIRSLANRVTSKTLNEEFKSFVAENQELLGDISHATQSAMEASDENLEWVEKHSRELTQYLQENVYTEPKFTKRWKSDPLINVTTTEKPSLRNKKDNSSITPSPKTAVNKTPERSYAVHVTSYNMLLVIVAMLFIGK